MLFYRYDIRISSYGIYLDTITYHTAYTFSVCTGQSGVGFEPVTSVIALLQNANTLSDESHLNNTKD